ncbi:MAG: hypothetical protein HRT94_05795 [Alphaproteobacteria bacterium]|nr:hypothetical protein [Alphaproteobacteria bacterium]
MVQIKTFIENNLSLLLFIGLLLGFVVPDMGDIADEFVIFFTAGLIFLSCADAKPADFLKIDIFQSSLFTITRFAVFPLVGFFLVKSFYPEFATGTLLLLLMPAGMAVASLCSMSKANVALGLGLTVMSSLLAPAIIPGVFAFLGQYVNVDITKLFITLLLIIFVPVLMYFLLVKKVPAAGGYIQKYNKSSAVILMSLVLMIVIASIKDRILEAPNSVVLMLVVLFGVFGLCYALGIIFSFFVESEDKVPYIIGSGAMNNALAVGLAFAYFDETTTLFIVLSEISWCFYVALAQFVLSKRAKA